MRFLFRMLLTINATFWMIVVYAIKENLSFWILSGPILWLLLLLIPIILSLISICLLRIFSDDEIKEVQEFSLADNSFLPTYLGYFFIALSVPNEIVMAFMYLIVFLFTYLSQSQYFNPIFLLFRYHYYHVLTPEGTRVFLICRGKVIRNKKDMIFEKLKRINDTTYMNF